MPRYRLYSDRLRDAQRAGTADVYQYDNVPERTRVQIRQIVEAIFGDRRKYSQQLRDFRENPFATLVQKTVCHEMGKDNFGHSATHPLDDLLGYLNRAPTPDFLDVLEFCCVVMTDEETGPMRYTSWGRSTTAGEAIDDINFRLRDGGVGFQFESGQLVRVDSEFAHAEVIKPAISLLNQEGFEGPQAEFLNAHDHYRAGRYKEAIAEAAKAFESLMKAVCDRKGWEFKKGARATDLLKILRAHKLWPDYLDASFDQLIATLASGLPQVRNEDAAHGQGATPKNVPDYVAAYALHLSAAKMILIAKAASI